MTRARMTDGGAAVLGFDGLVRLDVFAIVVSDEMGEMTVMNQVLCVLK